MKLTAASTMPASAGIVAVLISAPKRGRPALDADDLGGLLVDLGGAGGEQPVAQAAGFCGRRDQVDAVLAADDDALDAADGRYLAAVQRGEGAAATATEAGPIRERTARSSPASSTSTWRPIL